MVKEEYTRSGTRGYWVGVSSSLFQLSPLWTVRVAPRHFLSPVVPKNVTHTTKNVRDDDDDDEEAEKRHEEEEENNVCAISIPRTEWLNLLRVSPRMRQQIWSTLLHCEHERLPLLTLIRSSILLQAFMDHIHYGFFCGCLWRTPLLWRDRPEVAQAASNLYHLYRSTTLSCRSRSLVEDVDSFRCECDSTLPDKRWNYTSVIEAWDAMERFYRIYSSFRSSSANTRLSSSLPSSSSSFSSFLSLPTTSSFSNSAPAPHPPPPPHDTLDKKEERNSLLLSTTTTTTTTTTNRKEDEIQILEMAHTLWERYKSSLEPLLSLTSSPTTTTTTATTTYHITSVSEWSTRFDTCQERILWWLDRRMLPLFQSTSSYTTLLSTLFHTILDHVESI